MNYEYKIGDKVKLIKNIYTSIPLNTVGEIIGHSKIDGQYIYLCRFPKEISLDSGYPKTFFEQAVCANEITKI
jgi:hypothetical protein